MDENQKQLTVGSLFSGIGGLELGLERTGGFRTIWQCEIDAYASAVLKKHWSNAPNLGDITKVKWEDVTKPDLICGGFPCQDISVAGKGAGIIYGTRSGLWSEFAKAIRALRPRYVLIENVPMLANRGLNIVLANLAEAGYDAEWHNISAASIGAWHKRERIFIIANSNDTRSCPSASGTNSNRKEKDKGWQKQPQQKPSRCGDVPDTDSSRLQAERSEQQAIRAVKYRGCGQTTFVSDTDKLTKLKEELKYTNPLSLAYINTKNVSDTEGSRQQSSIVGQTQEQLRRSHTRNRECENAIWAAEPDVGRVANGVPSRVDRIKCLGNAVVPQVAQVVGEMILEMEKNPTKR